LEEFSAAYIDAILVFSEMYEEHLKHIEQVFHRLRQHKLKLKLTKCDFAQSETNYLGFVIGKNGLKPDPNKVTSIQNMTEPTTVKQVMAYIGCLSYYRRFIPGFQKQQNPLLI
jgi:putative transposase